MATVAVETRKRCDASFLDEPSPMPPHLAKRGRFTPCAASVLPPPLAFDPLDTLGCVFPGAGPRDLEARLAASGRDIHAAVQAYRAQQARDALASRLALEAGAAGGGAVDNDEYTGVLVEQMAAATDVADAKNRASWVLRLIKNAVAEHAAREATAKAARTREENAALRERAAAAERDNAVLKHGMLEAAARMCEENAALRERAAAAERDSTVLKCGVLAQQRRHEEMERAAAAASKKVAELEMANYALGVRLRDADGCRFQTHRGPTCFDANSVMFSCKID